MSFKNNSNFMSDLKRRTFIRNTVITGFGTSIAPNILQAQKENFENEPKKIPSAEKKKVIVAGAGITGLCCGYELMKAGHNVTILEASGRYGGHVFTGRDGLSDGLYADFGADHITKPGYEKFFEYCKEFNLTVIPYPNAEGSEAAAESNSLKMIDGKFYTPQMLADPAVLKQFGFNEKEVQFLSQHPWYELQSLYLNSYLSKFKDPYQPFGVGYDDMDNIAVSDLYKKEGASDAALRFLGEKDMTADYLVNCITLPVFKNIPVTPALSLEKQYVVDNLSYSSHPFFVFECGTKFWLDDGFKSINMEFEHPDISSIWMETNAVDSSRIILKAYGPSGVSPQRVLAAFREVYPGKHDTIEQAITKDWSKDKYAPVCEMEPFPIGEMHKFWPQIMMPEGRIYFAGTYAVNLSRGMESCIRSAQRVAAEISKV